MREVKTLEFGSVCGDDFTLTVSSDTPHVIFKDEYNEIRMEIGAQDALYLATALQDMMNLIVTGAVKNFRPVDTMSITVSALPMVILTDQKDADNRQVVFISDNGNQIHVAPLEDMTDTTFEFNVKDAEILVSNLREMAKICHEDDPNAKGELHFPETIMGAAVPESLPGTAQNVYEARETEFRTQDIDQMLGIARQHWTTINSVHIFHPSDDKPRAEMNCLDPIQDGAALSVRWKSPGASIRQEILLDNEDLRQDLQILKAQGCVFVINFDDNGVPDNLLTAVAA